MKVNGCILILYSIKTATVQIRFICRILNFLSIFRSLAFDFPLSFQNLTSLLRASFELQNKQVSCFWTHAAD